jgi:very-short-patch-repair endonuclease
MTTATHPIVTHVTHKSHGRRDPLRVGPTSGKYHPNQGPHSWDAVIGEVAGRHHGVVSLAHLRELGVPEHVVRARRKAERWYALHRGVYAIGHQALTARSHLIAAVYACGPGALASHRAAGQLHGFLSWGAIEVTAPRGRKPKPGIIVHRSRKLHPDDRAEVDGIPTTSVARTLVDLADVLNERQLTRAVRQTELLKVFDLRAIDRALARVPGRKGRHRLRRVLIAYQPEPHLLRSKAERRLKRLCARHHLPQPQFNVQIRGYEVDAYWPDADLVLEFDGVETHQTVHAFHADRRRDRALAAEGIQTLRVTWPDLEAPLMKQVQAILRHR